MGKLYIYRNIKQDPQRFKNETASTFLAIFSKATGNQELKK